MTESISGRTNLAIMVSLSFVSPGIKTPKNCVHNDQNAIVYLSSTNDDVPVNTNKDSLLWYICWASVSLMSIFLIIWLMDAANSGSIIIKFWWVLSVITLWYEIDNLRYYSISWRMMKCWCMLQVSNGYKVMGRFNWISSFSWYTEPRPFSLVNN